MPEVTDSLVRIPNPRYKLEDFEADWFRVLVLSEDMGISALLGKLKNPEAGPIAARTYVFEKDNGWDLDSARKWVDDHSLKAEVSVDVSDEDLTLAALVTPDIIERYGRPEKVYRDWHGRFTKKTGPDNPDEPKKPKRKGRLTTLLEEQAAKDKAAKEAESEAKAAKKKAESQAEAARKKAERNAERDAAKAKSDAEKAGKEEKTAAEKAAREAKASAEKADKEARAAADKAEREQTATAKEAARLAKAEADKLAKEAAKSEADRIKAEEKAKALAEKAEKEARTAAEKAAKEAKAAADKAEAKEKSDAEKAAKEAERKKVAAEREAQRIAQAAEKERKAEAARVAKELDQQVSGVKSQITGTGGSVEQVQSTLDRLEDVTDQIKSKTSALDTAKQKADEASREMTRLKRQLQGPDLTATEQASIVKRIETAKGNMESALARAGSLENEVRKYDRDLRRLKVKAGKEVKMIDESIGSLKKLLSGLKSSASGASDSVKSRIDELATKLNRLTDEWKSTPIKRVDVLASMTSIAEETEDLILDYGDGEINRIADEFYAIDPEADEVDIIASVKVGGFLVNGFMSDLMPMMTEDWSFGPADAAALLGEKGDDWKTFARAHLIIDVRDGGSAENLPQDRGKYMFPVARMVDGKLRYFAKAVPSVMAALNSAKSNDSAPWWTAAVRQTAYQALKAMYEHMGDDAKAPELMMNHADCGYGFEMKLSSDQRSEGDGLVWKPILRKGHWAGVNNGEPIDITSEMMDDIVSAFNAGVIEHVDVPLGHEVSVDQNAGFVKALQKMGDELWAGIKFTEPSIAEKIQRGTIANVSAWLKGSFTDWRNGKKWPWVLWHVALTNKPMITELTPFGGPQAAMSVHRYSYEQRREESKDMPDEIKLSRDDYDKLLGLKNDLEASNQRLVLMEKAAHQTDVKQIIASLQGRGAHEKVKVPESRGFPAAVITAVQPYLEADLGQPRDIKFSVDGQDQAMSVTDVVLSMLNAVAAATPGALISTAPVGPGVSSVPLGEPIEADEDRNKRIDGYLAARGLGPKKSD